MKILFVQISDIHWKENSSEEHVNRFSKIGQSIAPHFVNPIDAIILLYGGDFVYSGREEEFEQLFPYLKLVSASIRSAFGDSPLYYTIGVPGNHDCDFSGDQSARDGLLKTMEVEGPKFMGTYSDVLLTPQQAFFDFLETLLDETPERTPLIANVNDRLAWKHILPVGNESLSILCFNTAWLSRIKEHPGKLFLPPNIDLKTPTAEFQASLLHHPLAWLNNSNAKSVRRQLFSHSDMVFTGHEHVRDTLHASLKDIGDTTFIEGNALFPDDSRDEAGFCASYINTETNTELRLDFIWENSNYSPYNGRSKVDPTQPNLPLDLKTNIYRRNKDWRFTDATEADLKNPQLELHRGQNSRVMLPDIFVCADLRELSSESNYEKAITVPGDLALETLAGRTAAFIVGPDESGKSSIAKMLTLHIKSKGRLPLRVDGTRIGPKSESFKPLIAELAKDHYGPQFAQDFLNIPTSEKAFVIDNYQFLPETLKHDHAIFDIASHFFGQVIVLCHDAEISPIELGTLSLRNNPKINVFTVPPLTYQRRQVLIDRWLHLSQDYGKNIVNDQKTETECHRLVNTVISNYIQPFPPYILAILQSIESGREVDLSASTHGHLYEVFIKAALAKRTTLTNYNVISTFIATLAMQAFQQDKRSFGDEFIELTYDRFRDETDLERDLAMMKKDLIDLRLLSSSASEYSFRENYIFYYFVAYYLKDRLEAQESRDLVRLCAENTWNQDYANVLLFLAHLSKDRFIVETMLEVARSTFRNVTTPSLEGELAFLPSDSIEHLTLEDSDEQSRETQLNTLRESSEEHTLSHTPYSLNRNATPDEIGLLGEFSGALKALQVLGQLLKNFPANFSPDKKVEIVLESIDLGLRTLGRYYEVAEANKLQALKDFAELVRTKIPGVLEREAKVHAALALSNLCHMATFGVVKRTSIAVGSTDLKNTYAKVFVGDLTPASALVEMSLKLDHAGNFPEESIIRLAGEMKDNPFALRILRTLVVRHFRLFHIAFPIRQRVGQKLSISYKQTLGLQNRDKLIPPPS